MGMGVEWGAGATPLSAEFWFKKGSCQLLAKIVHEVLVNRLGGRSLPRKSVVRLTDRTDMTLDVYRGRKTTIQQNYSLSNLVILGNILHYRVWSLCNQLLLQFSMDHFETTVII